MFKSTVHIDGKRNSLSNIEDIITTGGKNF